MSTWPRAVVRRRPVWWRRAARASAVLMGIALVSHMVLDVAAQPRISLAKPGVKDVHFHGTLAQQDGRPFMKATWTRELTDELFKSLHSMVELRINNNKALTAFPDGVFRDLSALRVMQLDFNGLSALQPRGFVNLTALEHIDLAGNKLAKAANSEQYSV